MTLPPRSFRAGTRVEFLVALVSVVLLLVSCGASREDGSPAARPAPRQVDAATTRRLQEALDLQRESYGATGMAAAVVAGGRLLWAGGSGVADRRTRAPVTGSTPFPVFGVTQMAIGTLAARLADRGRVDLDSPLADTLPEWPFGRRITLRMLLNHTSGVGDGQRRLERATEMAPREIWSPQRTLAYVRSARARRPPQPWDINNANYILAGLVLERSTGQRLSRLLREEISDPLGLEDTVLQPQERPRGQPARAYGGPPRIARALRTRGTYVPYNSEASWLGAAGGMVSSAASLARLTDAALGGDLLGPAARKEVLRFVPAADGYLGYGLGVGRGRLGVEDVWGSFGFGPQYGSVASYVPGKALSVVVLTSGDADLRLTTAQLLQALG